MSVSEEIFALGPPPTRMSEAVAKTTIPARNNTILEGKVDTSAHQLVPTSEPRDGLEALAKSWRFTPLSTRRSFLKGLAAAGATAGLLSWLKFPVTPINPDTVAAVVTKGLGKIFTTDPNRGVEVISATIHDTNSGKSEDWWNKLERDGQGNVLPFDNRETNKIATELGFRVEDFFKPKPDLLKKIASPLNSVPLMPIFPPSVLMNSIPGTLTNQEIINSSAEKYKIPANVIAWLMTTESMGDRKHEAPGKVGLFNVAMSLFGKDVSEDEMKDPMKNAEYALKRLWQCYDRAKYIKANLSEGELWGYAVLAYKYGEVVLNTQYEKLPFEQRLYFENYTRTMVFGEIALKLKRQGKTDAETTQALLSTTLTHRLSTLNKLVKYCKDGKFSLNTYNENAQSPPPENYWKEAISQISEQRPEFDHSPTGPDSKQNTGSEMGNKLYMFALGGPQFNLKAIPPHMRMFMLTGGDYLLQSDKRNMNEEKWKLLTTDRNEIAARNKG